MISIKNFEFNPFSENTLVLWDETLEAIIIDPGCYESTEQQALTTFIEEQSLKVVRLLNTHCHIDHCLGNQFVIDKYTVGLEIPEGESETLASIASYAPMYGFENYQPAAPSSFIDLSSPITFGNSRLDVLFVPGHSPAHVAFVNTDQKICIGGDVLFRGSIGRTDLPGGNFETLITSIKEQLFALDDTTVVYPGHGPTTTIGEEKISNPFVGQNPVA